MSKLDPLYEQSTAIRNTEPPECLVDGHGAKNVVLMFWQRNDRTLDTAWVCASCYPEADRRSN